MIVNLLLVNMYVRYLRSRSNREKILLTSSHNNSLSKGQATANELFFALPNTVSCRACTRTQSVHADSIGRQVRNAPLWHRRVTCGQRPIL